MEWCLIELLEYFTFHVPLPVGLIFQFWQIALRSVIPSVTIKKRKDY